MSSKIDLVEKASRSAKGLQLEEIHRIRDAWLKFDVNGDGEVRTSEVDQVLNQLNLSVPESEIARIQNELDRNKNGTIEFVEFVMAYERGLFKNL